MAMNSKKQVEDFIIEYAIKSALESSHCVVKHDRKIVDFIEYAKRQPFKFVDGVQKNGADFRSMVVDYFEADKEHYFEIVRKMKKRKEELRRIESELAISEELICR